MRCVRALCLLLLTNASNFIYDALAELFIGIYDAHFDLLISKAALCY